MFLADMAMLAAVLELSIPVNFAIGINLADCFTGEVAAERRSPTAVDGHAVVDAVMRHMCCVLIVVVAEMSNCDFSLVSTASAGYSYLQPVKVCMVVCWRMLFW